jgi:hypothetical protein
MNEYSRRTITNGSIEQTNYTGHCNYGTRRPSWKHAHGYHFFIDVKQKCRYCLLKREVRYLINRRHFGELYKIASQAKRVLPLDRIRQSPSIGVNFDRTVSDVSFIYRIAFRHKCKIPLGPDTPIANRPFAAEEASSTYNFIRFILTSLLSALRMTEHSCCI